MKRASQKQYVVLGLGVFGSTIAKTLSKHDCEVLAIDRDIKCVERLADIVTQAVQADITDKEALAAAGVGDCDVAIIAVGSHLEEAIMALINVKELGAPFVIAKAKNKRSQEILLKVGADKVVRPEKEIGEQTAKSLLSQNIIDLIDIDSDFSIAEINAPEKWVGKTFKELDLRTKYGINVIGVRQKSHNKLNISPSAEYVVEKNDHMILVADQETFEKFDYLNKI